jgi:hypothetical protein
MSIWQILQRCLTLRTPEPLVLTDLCRASAGGSGAAAAGVGSDVAGADLGVESARSAILSAISRSIPLMMSLHSLPPTERATVAAKSRPWPTLAPRVRNGCGSGSRRSSGC